MPELIATKVAGLTLRFAGEEDVALIFDFIKQLAVYEKMSDQVVADEELLRKSLFGGQRVAEVVIAELDGNPVGFALFFHNFSTFLGRHGLYLEDLFVLPEFRGRGIGKALLVFLAKLAVERGCGRFEWSVLDWNKPAIDFYLNLGAVAMDEWTVYRLTGETLENLAREF
jgi:GNAT superfamily N-acetyltransferase